MAKVESKYTNYISFLIMKCKNNEIKTVIKRSSILSYTFILRVLEPLCKHYEQDKKTKILSAVFLDHHSVLFWSLIKIGLHNKSCTGKYSTISYLQKLHFELLRLNIVPSPSKTWPFRSEKKDAFTSWSTQAKLESITLDFSPYFNIYFPLISNFNKMYSIPCIS